MDHNTLLKSCLTGTNKIFKGDIAIRIWTIIKFGNEDNNVKLNGEYTITVRGHSDRYRKKNIMCYFTKLRYYFNCIIILSLSGRELRHTLLGGQFMIS
jgi:hypothetical protein